MREMTAVEAKVRFGAALEAVERGEEILVTRNGRPVARICPVGRSESERAAAARELSSFSRGRTLGLPWRELRDWGRK
jgi:prevent-host-death family protein